VGAKRTPRRFRLEAMSLFVEGSYESFGSQLHYLESLPPAALTDMEKEDLQHCYVAPTQPLNRLKADIATHLRNACPVAAALCQYCGLSYAPSDFDHYLPKEIFAEFSVLSLNLTPCCGRCNQLKQTAWLDQGGFRRIVSFYYDTLPASQFLFADVIMNEVPLAQFSLSDNAAEYGGLERTIRSHFEQLQLLSRFAQAAPVIFSEVTVELGEIVALQGTAAASQMLLTKAQQTIQSHSPNYWKVPLYQAMAASQDFLETL
jgi:hypothetical protein